MNNLFENVSTLDCTFEGDVLRSLVDFRGHPGTQDGSSRGNWGKCKNEQRYKVLPIFLLLQGVENRRKNKKSRIENDSKLECTFEGDF